ncbi:septation protein SepH, partial [Bifidobacterium parmae]
MPDNSPRGARLDHVSEAGDLVFEAGGERFVVTVDEALERALLEAKQIRSETLKRREPRTTDTLPISQIQQLIRAGADPAKVAARYGLAEALVRRFSASVQTEKQYAIEQFKRVPAPKESRLRTLEEIIDMTLLAARVDRSTLSWSATRRHHEPWHIVARFMSAGRKVHAEWTWDMHDNSVVCLNAAARKLIGEQSLGVGPEPDASAAASGVAGAPSVTRPAAAPSAGGRESFPVNLGAAAPAAGQSA